MTKSNYVLSAWTAKKHSDKWVVTDTKGQVIATIENVPNARNNAKLVSSSPYMLETLKAVVNLIGDEDLPNNGELSGAAISDMVRAAVNMADSSTD